MTATLIPLKTFGNRELDLFSLRIRIDRSQLPGVDDLTGHLMLLAIDQSGSMQSQYPQVAVALRELEVRTESLPPLWRPRCVVYSSHAETISIADARRRFIGGGTSFTAAFRRLDDELSRALADMPTGALRRVSVIFMTDGQDNQQMECLPAARTAFETRLRALPLPTQVHCVGFTADIDGRLLKSLTTAGSTPGAFRYCEPRDAPDALHAKISELLEMLVLVPTCTATAATGAFAAREVRLDECTAEDLDDGETLETTISGLTRAQADALVAGGWVELHMSTAAAASAEGGGATTGGGVRVPVVVAEDVSVYDALALLGDAAHTRPDDVHAALSAFNVFRPIAINGRCTPRAALAARDALLAARGAVQARVDAALKLRADAITATADGRTGYRLRDLQDAARFGLGPKLKAPLSRALDVRAARNARVLSELEGRLVREHATVIDAVAALPAGTAGVDDEDYVCDFSGANVRETLVDTVDDVMGFCLRVRVPPHAVMSGLVDVELVSPTALTFQTFLSALRHQVDAVGLEGAHGGFRAPPAADAETAEGDAAPAGQPALPEDAARGFRGRGREVVNAWVPLYVHDVHWRRVHALLPAALGQLFTLSPLGFDGRFYLGLYHILGSTLAAPDASLCARTRAFRAELLRVCAASLPAARRARLQGLRNAAASAAAAAAAAAAATAADTTTAQPEEDVAAAPPEEGHGEEAGWHGGDVAEQFFDPTTTRWRMRHSVSSLATVIAWGMAAGRQWTQADAVRVEEELLRRCVQRELAATPAHRAELLARLLYGSAATRMTTGGERAAEMKSGKVAGESVWERVVAGELDVSAGPVEVVTGEVAVPSCDVTAGGVAADRTVRATAAALMAPHVGALRRVHTMLRAAGYTGWSLCAAVGEGEEAAKEVRGTPEQLLVVRAVLVQCVLYHANAWTAAYADTVADPAGALQRAHDAHVALLRRMAEQEAGLAVARERARRLVFAESLVSFAGRALSDCRDHSNTPGSRSGAVFDALVEGLTIQSSPVPLRDAKITMLVMGTFTPPASLRTAEGGGVVNVFGGGHVWIPEEKVRERLRAALSPEALEALYDALPTDCAYRYRDYGPNRHGHSNDNPSAWALAQGWVRAKKS